jgi:hypothetical protein
MKRTRITKAAVTTLASLIRLALVAPALASDAQTSATATGGRGRSGTATASARYEGDIGFARTDTRSGSVNLARGVAVGFDEDGLSLSLSLALAPKRGPAVATTFNISLDRDGEVATSVGTALATGGTSRSVSAGGSTAATTYRPVASATTAGVSRNGGVVRTYTHSDRYVSRETTVRRIIRVR